MSLESKLAAYLKSPAAKKKIDAKMQEYHSSGAAYTTSGVSLAPEDRMMHASAKFMELLHKNALACDLPASVIKHIEDMMSARPIQTKDGFELPLFLGGDLHRNSLDDGWGIGSNGYNGIDNIVALFNNGYTASNYVYGWWYGHRGTTPEVRFRSGDLGFGDVDDAWVRSKISREPLHFIQQTIADFNGNYGADYDVTAVAADIYMR